MDKYYLILMCVLLCACGSKKVVPAVERVDSVVIVKEKVVHVHDTIPYEIPSQQSLNVTVESHSFLENDFAWTSADVDSCGVLSHRLETKDRVIDIPVVRDSVVRDSVVYVDKEKPVPYPVERKFSWWEKICIDVLPIVTLVCIIVIFFFIYRKRRK